jgi:hypothetical protein
MRAGIQSKGLSMRISFVVPVLLVCSAAYAAETEVIPEKVVPATLTVEQPDNPKGSKPDAPIIQSVSARVDVRLPNGQTFDIVPDFHFIAPKGNAIVIHREVVDSNAPSQVHINPAGVITTPPEAQKQGAVVSGGWRCGPPQYHVTIKAVIMDSDGNRSNEVKYTVHCNGG